MSFSHPAWLALAAAAAVPLVLHLLRRRIGNRVALPTVRYLERAEAEHSRELRLRNRVLMALRIAALVMLAAAAAHPLLAVAGARGPAALAIVVDNSMSAGAVARGGSTLDELLSAVRNTLARAREGDRIWIVTADGRVEAGTPADAVSFLPSTRPIAGRGNLAAAIGHARSAVEGSGLPGTVAIVTDGQVSQWDERTAAAARGATVFTVNADPPANGAVVEARPDPPRWTGSGSVVIGFVASDSSLFRVGLGGVSLRGIAEPDARVSVRMPAPRRGWHAGIVERERDELAADDVRHLAVLAADPPRVRVDSAAGRYAAAAVATLVDAARAAIGADIFVGAADRLAGKPALLFAPAEPLRVGAANRALAAAGIPVQLSRPVFDSAAIAFRGRATAGGFVRTRFALHVVARDTSERVDTVATAGGEPWIVAGDGFVLVGSALDPSHTSFPVSAAFVPWLEQMLTLRLSDEGGVIEALTGDTVAIPAWADGVEGIVGRAPFAASRPGVSFLMKGGRRAGAIVVNPAREESLLERLGTRQLQARLGRSARVTADARAFDRSLLDAPARADATGAAIVGVLVLLAAEMLARSSVLRRSV